MNTISLKHLAIGKRATILALAASGTERRRLLDLGLVPGTVTEALQRSPSGDPVAYLVRGAVIALRGEDAEKILVSPLNKP